MIRKRRTRNAKPVPSSRELAAAMREVLQLRIALLDAMLAKIGRSA